MLLGKFFTGVAAGGYNVFCPKYIMEVAPKEISGSAGATFCLIVCVGITINSIIAIPYGDLTIENSPKDKLVFIYFLLQLVPMSFALM